MYFGRRVTVATKVALGGQNSGFFCILIICFANVITYKIRIGILAIARETQAAQFFDQRPDSRFVRSDYRLSLLAQSTSTFYSE